MQEIIRGNHDGPAGANQTYTICRIAVPREVLVEEVKNDWHPGYHTVKIHGREYPRANPDRLFLNNINKKSGRWRCVAQTDSGRAEAVSEERPSPSWSQAKMIEFIHGNRDGENRANDTYTICRLAVPETRLVEEIEKGLHPDYRVVNGKPIAARRGIKSIDQPWMCGMVPPRPDLRTKVGRVATR